MEPASIRYNNPGAMWGGNPISKKWGETSHVTLNDGLGQGNQIAMFPTKVQGAAAQFDLWRTPRYRGKPLAVTIQTWSGGNSWQQYVGFLTAKTPGLTSETIIDDAFLASPVAISMMKAQAWHEAGRPYPMTDDEWAEAQKMALTGVIPAPRKPAVKRHVAAGTVVAGTVAAGAHQGWGPSQWILAAFIAAGIVTAIYLIRKNTNS